MNAENYTAGCTEGLPPTGTSKEEYLLPFQILILLLYTRHRYILGLVRVRFFEIVLTLQCQLRVSHERDRARVTCRRRKPGEATLTSPSFWTTANQRVYISLASRRCHIRCAGQIFAHTLNLRSMTLALDPTISAFKPVGCPQYTSSLVFVYQ